MSDVTLLTLSDLILAALVAGIPGMLLGGGIGAWFWRSNRAAGALLVGLIGIPLSLGAAFVLLILIVK